MQDTDKKVTDTQTNDAATLGRRKLIKALGATGGALAATTLTAKWEAPFIELSKLAAHSVTTQEAFAHELDHTHTGHAENHSGATVQSGENKLTQAGGNDGQTRKLVASDGPTTELGETAKTVYVSTSGISDTAGSADLISFSAKYSGGVCTLDALTPGDSVESIERGAAVSLKNGESVVFNLVANDSLQYELELIFSAGTWDTTSTKDNQAGTDTPVLELHSLVEITY